ncbi:MAG: hypothetical protein JWP04_1959 [Belnapia sp.]|nr:hypothetical protein [Belnapia sp.]
MARMRYASVMRRRRIFRPAPGPRRWGALAVCCGALACSLVVATALPGNLFGSAPRDQRWAAAAPEVRVLDGDALRLGDRVLRLAGITVPDRGQAQCRDAAGAPLDCAAGAAAALSRLVEGWPIDCQIQGQDRHGRALGICRAGELDLSAALIGAGWALAGPDNPALMPLETVPRLAGQGLWAPGAAPPGGWPGRF